MVTPEAMADLFHQEMEAQKESDANFRESQAEFNRRMQEALAAKVRGPQTPQLSPEIQQIVQLMQMNPIIVPHVQKYVTELLKRIQSAIQKELGGDVTVGGAGE